MAADGTWRRRSAGGRNGFGRFRPRTGSRRVRSSFPVVDEGDVSNRVATELLGEASTGSGVEQDEVLGAGPVRMQHRPPPGTPARRCQRRWRLWPRAGRGSGHVSGRPRGPRRYRRSRRPCPRRGRRGPVGDNCPRAGELVREVLIKVAAGMPRALNHSRRSAVT